MKDRLVTAIGALLLLAVVYGLVFAPAPEVPVTRPVSVEAGRNGYRAIHDWLAGQGVAVASLRERFERLLDDDMPFTARGNILLTTMPYANPLRREEQGALRRWIAAGNTVLVMAALDDTPEWSVGTTAGQFFGELYALSGLRFEVDGAAAEPAENPSAAGGAARGANQLQTGPPGPEAIPPDTPVELGPVGAHPLMAGVESLRGYSDGPSSVWRAASAETDPLVLRLGVERGTGIDAVWEAPQGDGQVIVVASGSLLTNHIVADGDARRFLANVIRHHLATGASVIFDDMHQGLSVLYDADAFFADPRLHNTIWFLLAGWLVYLLGSSNRFGPPRQERDAPRQADFLDAVGGFMGGRLDRRDAGLVLFDEWFDDIRRARSLPPSAAPPWAELAATPTLGRDVLDELEREHGRLTSGRTVDLVRLHNTLRQARKAIG